VAAGAALLHARGVGGGDAPAVGHRWRGAARPVGARCGGAYHAGGRPDLHGRETPAMEQQTRTSRTCPACGGYRLALFDYWVPDRDGVTLWQGIRGRRPGPVGVPVTACAVPDAVAAATAAGMRRVLGKPVDFGQLLPLLGEVLGGHRSSPRAPGP
jgi:CheY-like chemotaxis protein